MRMDIKPLLRSVIRNIPGKHLAYAVARRGVLHSAAITVDDSRNVLERFSPKPTGARGTQPKFVHDVPTVDVSIIVPAYNVADYVGPCLDSILAQDTSATFEVIVVNDGSMDGTREVIERYSGDGHVTIIDQPNAGLAGARNTGIDHARGRYLMFVDSDDEIAPTHVEHLLAALCGSAADYVTSLYGNIDEQGKLLSVERKRVFGTAWGRLFKREVWADIRFPEGYLFEDTVLAFAVATRFRETTCGDTGYWYRRRTASISNTAGVKPRYLDTYWIVEAMLVVCRRVGIRFDERLYRLTVEHLGLLLYLRTAGFPEHVRRAAFVEAGSLLRGTPEFTDMRLAGGTREERDMERALRGGNYRLWLTAGRFLQIETL